MSSRAWRLLTSAVLLVICGCTSPGRVAVSPKGTGSPATQPQAVIRRTDFQITYVLQGESETGAVVDLMSDPQLAFVPEVPTGSKVAQGRRVGRAIVDPGVQAALQAGARASSLDRGELTQLRVLQGPVAAAVSGVFSIVAGRPVIQDPGVDVVVGLLPIQYLRYQSIPFSGQASIETLVGNRQVPCAAVWVQSAGSSSAGSDAPYELHCRLPGFVETAAGLTAQVTLHSTLYRNVVVVPNIYVGYDQATDGYFINVIAGGKKEKLPITVGVTDGVVRVVTSSVPVGAVLVLPQGS